MCQATILPFSSFRLSCDQVLVVAFSDSQLDRWNVRTLAVITMKSSWVGSVMFTRAKILHVSHGNKQTRHQTLSILQKVCFKYHLRSGQRVHRLYRRDIEIADCITYGIYIGIVIHLKRISGNCVSPKTDLLSSVKPFSISR